MSIATDLKKKPVEEMLNHTKNIQSATTSFTKEIKTKSFVNFTKSTKALHET